MTFNASHNSTDFNLHQRLLAANNLTLAHIARGAPLEQTLSCIVNGIADQHPDISAAILLLDEDRHQLHLGAAPGLPQDYRRAIDGIASDADSWAHQAAADKVMQISAGNIEASRFWRNFRDLALQYGLHACMRGDPDPIRHRLRAGHFRRLFAKT